MEAIVNFNNSLYLYRANTKLVCLICTKIPRFSGCEISPFPRYWCAKSYTIEPSFLGTRPNRHWRKINGNSVVIATIVENHVKNVDNHFLSPVSFCLKNETCHQSKCSKEINMSCKNILYYRDRSVAITISPLIWLLIISWRTSTRPFSNSSWFSCQYACACWI